MLCVSVCVSGYLRSCINGHRAWSTAVYSCTSCLHAATGPRHRPNYGAGQELWTSDHRQKDLNTVCVTFHFIFITLLIILLWCPVFETQVIPRISSYPWNKKQQHFSNIKSRVILGVTRRKLPRHYRWDKLGINSGQEKWLLSSTTMTICGNRLIRMWTYSHQGVVPRIVILRIESIAKTPKLSPRINLGISSDLGITNPRFILRF